MVAAACKDPQAFAILYDRYIQPIYRYLYSKVGSSPDAEDLTAQTFLSALESHKTQLGKRIERLQRLVQTVDNTLEHLKGENEMSKRQLFEAFSDEQQAEYEKEAAQKYDPATVKESQRKWKSYSAADKQRIGEEGNAAYESILAAIPKGASSPEAQAGVERWRQHMAYFWVPNDDQLAGLADLYNDDPRFKANFDKIDPRLAEFMREAVRIYVANRKK